MGGGAKIRNSKGLCHFGEAIIWMSLDQSRAALTFVQRMDHDLSAVHEGPLLWDTPSKDLAGFHKEAQKSRDSYQSSLSLNTGQVGSHRSKKRGCKITKKL